MTGMKKIIECVPNFSEGRDLDKIEKIVKSFQGKDGVKLLDYQRDEDHNRLVVTVVHVSGVGKPVNGTRSFIYIAGWAICLGLAYLTIKTVLFGG